MISSAFRRGRGAAVLALVLALVLQLVVLVGGAAPAGAEPCQDCPPGGGGGGGGTLHTYTSVLTITPPAVGTVYGKLHGTDTTVFDCSATGGTCTHTDTLTAVARPTTGWPTYDLTPDVPDGYTFFWTQGCLGLGACSVTNSQPTTTVVANSYDSQKPQVTIAAPDRVGPSTAIIANATDNSGSVTYYWWYICPGSQTDCSGPIYAAGAAQRQITLAGQPGGRYTILVDASDAHGNIAGGTAEVTLVDSVQVLASGVPAATEAPSLTFSSPNDEAHVVARECRAYRQNASPTDWTACTSPYAPTLADGIWVLEAQETDDLGLTGTTGPVVTRVDTTAPRVSVGTDPPEGSVVTAQQLPFSFVVDDLTLQSVSCSLDGATPTPCTSPYQVTGYLNGAHRFTVTAVDAVGHTTSVTRHFVAAIRTRTTPQHTSVRTTYGHPATLSATVSPASAHGSISFRDKSGALLCRSAVHNGVATCVTSAHVPGGKHSVTASYAGTFSSSSAALTLTVAKAATQLRARTATRVHRGSRHAVSVWHLPSNATGTVVVTWAGHTLCTASVHDGRAHCRYTVRMRPGAHRLSVAYRGNGNYRASTVNVRIKTVR